MSECLGLESETSNIQQSWADTHVVYFGCWYASPESVVSSEPSLPTKTDGLPLSPFSHTVCFCRESSLQQTRLTHSGLATNTKSHNRTTRLRATHQKSPPTPQPTKNQGNQHGARQKTRLSHPRQTIIERNKTKYVPSRLNSIISVAHWLFYLPANGGICSTPPRFVGVVSFFDETRKCFSAEQ
jgi:hypothetical protein